LCIYYYYYSVAFGLFTLKNTWWDRTIISIFRKNSSTAVATYNLLDNIYMALNNRCIVGGIFSDLSKAFD
jgi:hypothetical protein